MEGNVKEGNFGVIVRALDINRLGRWVGLAFVGLGPVGAGIALESDLLISQALPHADPSGP
ncbi:MAG TPA: hypothetical protein PKE64_25745, partial [Anaerolineae bacterium]|nr:hypothetical protein [Anaerolineae bacterium]